MPDHGQNPNTWKPKCNVSSSKKRTIGFLLTFLLYSPKQSSVFCTSPRTVGAYEEMRCAHLGFPRALQVSGSHQGKCRFETPALPQRPVAAMTIYLYVHHVTNTQTLQKVVELA
jgi:hypothetical protein